jgi:hypothetical protein
MKSALFAALAIIATATAEPIKDQDKLTVRATGTGDKKVIEVTARADKQPLSVVWGSRKEDRTTVQPGETKKLKLTLGPDYKITASEGGKVVDTESARRKTGLNKDRSLR